MLSPATVTWWEGEPDHIAAWLTVRAGSPPLEQEAWLAQLAVAAPDPGDWAAVCAIPLGGLGEELAARLQDPIGAGRPGLSSVVFAAGGAPLAGEASAKLYDDCRAAALGLVGERMRDAVVAREPRHSGLMLLRLAHGTDGPVLDLAPAIDEPGWRGRPIDLDLGADVQEPTFGRETVSVDGAAVTLPCAHLRLERGSTRCGSRFRSYTCPGRPTRWCISHSADRPLRTAEAPGAAGIAPGALGLGASDEKLT